MKAPIKIVLFHVCLKITILLHSWDCLLELKWHVINYQTQIGIGVIFPPVTLVSGQRYQHNSSRSYCMSPNLFPQLWLQFETRMQHTDGYILAWAVIRTSMWQINSNSNNWCVWQILPTGLEWWQRVCSTLDEMVAKAICWSNRLSHMRCHGNCVCSGITSCLVNQPIKGLVGPTPHVQPYGTVQCARVCHCQQQQQQTVRWLNGILGGLWHQGPNM